MEAFWLIIFAFILAAFFSGIEIAFVSSSQLRFEIEKEHNRFSSRILSYFFRHQEAFIVTTLLGNTVAIVVFSSKMAQVTLPLLTFSQSELIILLIQTFISSIFLLFFAEYIPKVISRSNAYFVLRSFILLFSGFYMLFYPLTWLIIRLYSLLFNMLRIPVHYKKIPSFSRIDFNYLVQENIHQKLEKEEPIHPDEEILQNALDFSNVKLRDCIIPRTELVAIEIQSATTEDLKQLFTETGHSKIILYQNDIDNIVGYIHFSEMFKHPDEWKKHINNVPIVPETMPAHRLMRLLNQMHKSLAVVVDEFGGTAGIVTMEDILEEIFGEIEDEHDKNKLVTKQINASTFILSARMEIEAINHLFHLELPESDQYITLAGLILHYQQHLPKVNEVVQIEHFEFRILKMEQNRIDLVKLTVHSPFEKN
ncbi:MAG: hemolysin family protein [Microbacter sp.]